MNRNKLGQYFTTNIILKNKVFQFIFNNPNCILEPSIGRGDLITFITDKLPSITFDMYEIDTSIKLLDNIKKDKVIYGDFLKQTILKKYTTIIGNPPYIRTKTGNIYISFIEKCYHLLEDNGELIFIVPSDFLKLTSSSKLLNELMTHGSFTHIYHPNNENMFDNASIDIIVFRYCKNIFLIKKVIYNDKSLYINNKDGFIIFNETENKNNKVFKDYFDIGVGFVSGKEQVYKNEELGNITILNGKDKFDKYIYIENFPCNNEIINNYLLEHKKILLERRIKKFDDNNWFKWGAARNIQLIRNNLDKDCIYIYNLTRKQTVSFIGKVNYFGGNLIILIPKQTCDLNKIISYLNSDKFKSNFIYSGRFKISHRCISNSFIPL